MGRGAFQGIHISRIGITEPRGTCGLPQLGGWYDCSIGRCLLQQWPISLESTTHFARKSPSFFSLSCEEVETRFSRVHVCIRAHVLGTWEAKQRGWQHYIGERVLAMVKGTIFSRMTVLWERLAVISCEFSYTSMDIYWLRTRAFTQLLPELSVRVRNIFYQLAVPMELLLITFIAEYYSQLVYNKYNSY